MAFQYIGDLISDQLTYAMIDAEFRGEVTEDEGKVYALGRKSEAKIRGWAARLAPQTPQTEAAGRPSEPLATERQVSYIMALIGRGAHEEGGFMNGPTTLEGVRRLTKREASIYITSLKGDY